MRLLLSGTRWYRTAVEVRHGANAVPQGVARPKPSSMYRVGTIFADIAQSHATRQEGNTILDTEAEAAESKRQNAMQHVSSRAAGCSIAIGVCVCLSYKYALNVITKLPSTITCTTVPATEYEDPKILLLYHCDVLFETSKKTAKDPVLYPDQQATVVT